jgi:hypothetical protein
VEIEKMADPVFAILSIFIFIILFYLVGLPHYLNAPFQFDFSFIAFLYLLANGNPLYAFGWGIFTSYVTMAQVIPKKKFKEKKYIGLSFNFILMVILSFPFLWLYSLNITYAYILIMILYLMLNVFFLNWVGEVENKDFKKDIVNHLISTISCSLVFGLLVMPILSMLFQRGFR